MDKFDVTTKMLYKRNIKQDRQVEKFNCRLITKVFWQDKGVRHSGCYW